MDLCYPHGQLGPLNASPHILHLTAALPCSPVRHMELSQDVSELLSTSVDGVLVWDLKVRISEVAARHRIGGLECTLCLILNSLRFRISRIIFSCEPTTAAPLRGKDRFLKGQIRVGLAGCNMHTWVYMSGDAKQEG